MLFKTPEPKTITELENHHYQDEAETLAEYISSLAIEQKAAIESLAKQLVQNVRTWRKENSGLDTFLYEYSLSSNEGIALMCLAEAFLRIPDKATVDRLIRDKITAADWQTRLQEKSDSTLVNTVTWGLMLTGKILNKKEEPKNFFSKTYNNLVRRSSEPVIRKAVQQAMKILSQQFVMGPNIESSLARSQKPENKRYRYSYDMLGEAAYTQEDADKYFAAYEHAIEAIAQKTTNESMADRATISVKLSALHPRYEVKQYQRVLDELAPRVLSLCELAHRHGLALTIDAEEANRLTLSLDVIAKVIASPTLKGWNGLGMAVQAYQKRAPHVIRWLSQLAQTHQQRFFVRLVKGAYWDSEIKHAQEFSLPNYPVFTRKMNTDVSYLACAKVLLDEAPHLYPQFATHNAHTIATLLTITNSQHQFEFQCLHGMGHSLYDQLLKDRPDVHCRVYAPVGEYESLLPYLVRRLLENGANTSFVNRAADDTLPINELVADPLEKVKALQSKAHPRIPLPVDIYGSQRKNARGIDLDQITALKTLDAELDAALEKSTLWEASALLATPEMDGDKKPVINPTHMHQPIASATATTAEGLDKALIAAHAAAERWAKTPVEERAACLDRAADLLETRCAEFMAIAIREAGKTIDDALAEVREAIDFCRYYANEARRVFKTHDLTGPTGESNQLQLHGRGPIVCISPWNFPLAIFLGQVTAALVAGNPVLAKPADQTPIIATQAVKLLHEAGIPQDVLQLTLGSGRVIGSKLVGDTRTCGVMFTGSTATAQTINQTLAQRGGAIVPFIAETGGQNAMIVDASALPEQVVADVTRSAFGSAGQRCSALRVLFLQEDIADKIITLLKGAMAELTLGDPAELATDIGPVIDTAAQTMLQNHFENMSSVGKLIYQVPVDPTLAAQGSFFGPCAFEISGIDLLKEETFGPFLHIVRYATKDLDQVIESINDTGYGLTLGIHSRINETIQQIIEKTHVGNIYVNRNMIGAVVGVQPFGGKGLSGTGPKAGGPHYLLRLCQERSISINTTAMGGNTSLLSLDETLDEPA